MLFESLLIRVSVSLQILVNQTKQTSIFHTLVTHSDLSCVPLENHTFFSVKARQFLMRQLGVVCKLYSWIYISFLET